MGNFNRICIQFMTHLTAIKMPHQYPQHFLQLLTGKLAMAGNFTTTTVTVALCSSHTHFCKY